MIRIEIINTSNTECDYVSTDRNTLIQHSGEWGKGSK